MNEFFKIKIIMDEILLNEIMLNKILMNEILMNILNRMSLTKNMIITPGPLQDLWLIYLQIFLRKTFYPLLQENQYCKTNLKTRIFLLLLPIWIGKYGYKCLAPPKNMIRI